MQSEKRSEVPRVRPRDEVFRHVRLIGGRSMRSYGCHCREMVWGLFDIPSTPLSVCILRSYHVQSMPDQYGVTFGPKEPESIHVLILCISFYGFKHTLTAIQLNQAIVLHFRLTVSLVVVVKNLAVSCMVFRIPTGPLFEAMKNV